MSKLIICILTDYESLVELFDGIEVIFVGVHCPLEELERREQGRTDRKA